MLLGAGSQKYQKFQTPILLIRILCHWGDRKQPSVYLGFMKVKIETIKGNVISYLIFVTGTTGGTCGEKLSCGKISPHGKFEEKSVMWRKEEKNLSGGEILPHEKCGHKFVLL